jgi:hypothetical protein
VATAQRTPKLVYLINKLFCLQNNLFVMVNKLLRPVKVVYHRTTAGFWGQFSCIICRLLEFELSIGLLLYYTSLDVLTSFRLFSAFDLFVLLTPFAIDLFNGYLTFVVSILMIGFVTAIIGDIAGHLGCFIFLKDSVNAIAFVALGTSVPGTQKKFSKNSCDVLKTLI